MIAPLKPLYKMANQHFTAIDFRNKAIESFLNWEKCLFVGVNSAGMARFCVEDVLKSVILNEPSLNVTDFSKTTFKDLFDAGSFLPGTKPPFAAYASYSLLKKSTSLLNDPNLDSCILEINSNGNDEIHKGKTFNKTEITIIEEKLLIIMNWFFTEILTNEPTNWKEVYIDSKIRDLPPSIVAKQITDFLNIYLNDIKKKPSELEDVQKIITNTESIILQLNNFPKLIEDSANKTHSILSQNHIEVIEEIRGIKKSWWQKKIPLIANKKIKLGAVVIVFLILGVAGVFGFFALSQKTDFEEYNVHFIDTTDNRAFNILILPFYNPENNSVSGIGSELLDRIQANNDIQKPPVEVKYLDRNIGHINPNVAKEIALQTGADMVIWGKDSEKKNDATHRISFHYLVTPSYITTSPNNYTTFDKTKNEEVNSLFEISEASLYLEIDDAIFWCLGTKYFNEGNNRLSSWYFSRLTTKRTSDKYNNFDLYLYLANCHNNLNNRKEMYKNLELGLKKDSSAKAFFSGGSFLGLIAYQEDTHLTRKIKADTLRLKTMEYYEKALLLDNTDWKIPDSYAGFLIYELNDSIKAKYYFEKALKLKNDPLIICQYADLLAFRFNEIDSAEKLYIKARNRRPSYDATILFSCATFLNAKKHDSKQSKLYYDMAFAINKAMFMEKHCFNYSILLLKNFKNTRGAKDFFEGVIKSDNQNILEFRSGILHYYYSVFLYHGLKNTKTANEEYVLAIKLDSTIKKLPHPSQHNKNLKPVLPFDGF